MMLQFGQAKENVIWVVLLISSGVSQVAVVVWRFERFDWDRNAQDCFCIRLNSVFSKFPFTQNLRI